MKLRTTALLFFLLLFCANFAHAQHVDAYFGIGSATDASSGQTLTDQAGNVTLAPKLDGVFGTIGGDFLMGSHFGIGGEAKFRFAQADYASGLSYRPIFYDFNAIYLPAGLHRVSPEFQGGIGGVNMRFYGGQSYYNPYSGTYSNFQGSSNHFQVHAGVGLRLYVTQSVFVRPQFDLHWVNNFTEFGHNYVPSYSVAVGYTF